VCVPSSRQRFLKGARESQALRHYDQDKSGKLSFREFVDLFRDKVLEQATEEKRSAILKPFVDNAAAELSRLGCL
jgi:Ca2+-binding EF-hand superfamily protein